MNVRETELPGVLVIEPRPFVDDRGFFLEAWHAPRYADAGLPTFVQDNVTGSHAGVLRGLHYQWPVPQGKLVQVLAGRVLDVAVDIRRGSATFRRWVAIELTAENHRQLWIPEGFAHGYAVLGAPALVMYKCTAPYVPENDRAIRWNDPALGIDWPIAEPVLSAKDQEAPFLADLAESALPGVPPVLP